MRFARLEMRLAARGWSRGTLYTGAVAGEVSAVAVTAGGGVAATWAGRHAADASRRPREGTWTLPTAHVQVNRRTLVLAQERPAGRVTALWCDRTTGVLTHLLVAARGGERIVPVALVEEWQPRRVRLTKGAPPLGELPLYREDVVIAREARLALAARILDPQAGRAIKLRVDDGQLSLVGIVETAETAAQARQAVTAIAGVRELVFDVVPLETLGQRVEARVAELMSQPECAGSAVHVLTEHGIVFLEGSAPTVAARAAMERAALGVPGARVVVNDIAVGGVSPSHATGTGPLVRNR